MSPLVRAQIKHINKAVADLRDLLRDSRERTESAQAERDRLLTEQWSLRKDLATLKRVANDSDAILADNERLRTQRAEIQNRLARILHCTKGLQREFRQ
ncbi:MAG TPA: hypothetical protein HPP77_11335 [Candidatus Hydrogenedentes bacterium]|nr:hypothetical protein [Candidatus Hydrogenedentota bacterium]HIJ72542.1 hypothetical protein [Candidatus Hydrogenedentota bacterium]